MNGPLDFTADLDTSSMLDLGALLLPNLQGLEVHLDLDPRSGIGKSVSLHLNMTIAEVQVFAAAANEDPWADMRNSIVAGLREQEVDCTVEIGRFGSEIYAVMPTVDLDGNTYVQPVRFVGVRGSRWLVRVVISGDGALLTNDEIASGVSEIDGVIAKLVVNRGEAPIPPGERLALRSPTVAAEDSGQPNNPESSGNFNFGSFHLQL
jgi:hypothetical protein